MRTNLSQLLQFCEVGLPLIIIDELCKDPSVVSLDYPQMEVFQSHSFWGIVLCQIRDSLISTGSTNWTSAVLPEVTKLSVSCSRFFLRASVLISFFFLRFDVLQNHTRKELFFLLRPPVLLSEFEADEFVEGIGILPSW
ncbi:hypothetical protein Tco_0898991 [Tanacetum coccineum]